MSQQQGQESQNQGSSFFILVAVVVIAMILFHFIRDDIVDFWRKVRMYELMLLSFIEFLPYLNTLGIREGYEWLEQTPANRITSDDIKSFDKHFGVLRYIYMPIPLLLGFKLYQGFTNRNRKYDMETLLVRVSNWKHMEFLKDFLTMRPDKDETIRLKKDGSNYGSAVAMTPGEYCTTIPAPNTKINRAIYEPPKDEEDPDDQGFFDKELARKSLDAQLGKQWKGNPDHLKDYERKLYDQLLADIIKSGYLADFEEKDEAKRKDDQLKGIMKELNSHAYIRTMFITLFNLAKGGGVNASLKYRWIKPIDRILWYCLSSVGRKTPFPESAGCHAHWELEKAVKMPIPFIETQMAVDGLEFTLFGPPEEEEDPIYN